MHYFRGRKKTLFLGLASSWNHTNEVVTYEIISGLVLKLLEVFWGGKGKAKGILLGNIM